MLKCCVVLIIVSSVLNFCSCFVNTSPNIAIIGTGPSGLVTAKYAIKKGFNVTVFEQNDAIGGVWWYTDEVGKNRYGIPIHTSMYKGLRTNVPTQMMQFSDHVYGKNILSFPHRKDIWNYLNSYALRFDIKKFTHFNHLVTNVTPIENNKWKVVAKDLPNDKVVSGVFDAVIVCNGHNFLPKIPIIEGAEDFSGKKIHSHDFRNAENFAGEKVLVIGSGSSGIDLVALLSKTADHVTWSRRSDKLKFPYQNVTYKPDVKRFTKTGAEFIDDTEETYTVIFYATGYNFDFPFLANDSGITVEDSFVQPLYKHIFNVEHPTLLFIGVSSGLHPTFPTIELQARFALKYLSGQMTLPSKDEMLNDIEDHIKVHMERHHNNRSSQFFAMEHRDYFLELSGLTNIDCPPEVISTMYLDNDAMRTGDPTTYRNYRYIVLDDVRYIKKKYVDVV